MSRSLKRIAYVLSIAAALLSFLPTFSPATSAAGNASVRVTLVSCSGSAKPFQQRDQCTKVIEDDGIEYLYPEGNRNERHPLLDSTRDAHGSYLISGLQGGQNYMFAGFEPIRRTSSYAEGVLDGMNGHYVTAVENETLDVIIFYFDGAFSGPLVDNQLHFVNDAVPASAASTVYVTLIVCPQGVNPQVGTGSCTKRVGADGTEYFVNLDTGAKYYVSQYGQSSDGTYILTDLPDGAYEMHGFEPVKTDHVYVTGVTRSQLMWVTNGRANVTLYYYYN